MFKNTFLRIIKSCRGFTMLELMVVVLIIGLLAGFAAPNFTGQYEKAKIGRTKAELKSMQNLVELYLIENEEYPSTGEFEKLMQDNGYPHWGSSMADPWGGAYHYQIDEGSKDSYVLWSEGPTSGDDDDILVTENEKEPLIGDSAEKIGDGMSDSSSLQVDGN
ncbi:MAG: type II secretion system protein GspG [Desulfotomaculum sp.]|nr:type II secretion system protein GspG [Desulfotomaculum sp.]